MKAKASERTKERGRSRSKKLDVQRIVAVESLRAASVFLRSQQAVPPILALPIANAIEGALKKTKPEDQNSALLRLLHLKRPPNSKGKKDARTAARASVAAAAVERRFAELKAEYGKNTKSRAEFGRRNTQVKTLACAQVAPDFGVSWQTVYRWHKESKGDIGSPSGASTRRSRKAGTTLEK
jgi:hypothetical protein